MATLEDYRNGGEGLSLWCEENVYAKIYLPGSDVSTWWPMGDLPKKPNPDTGRSYHYMWERQKEVLCEAFEMSNGAFKHRLIVFCWPRGEGKSYLSCLSQLWKFFCWPAQQIMLGANSKDQVKFVHYDIMRDLIVNSPRLKKIVGERNIQEKEIRLQSRGRVVSIIRSISSFSGIVSNITGYTFSEIFDMKNPKFFVQLDGSIRNMPNAFGTIDSTVSEKTHVLRRLYETFEKGADNSLYFSHRVSKKASFKDFWHPFMTKDQLDSYRNRFPPAEFSRYFRNTWEAASSQLFTPDIVDAMGYIGLDGIFSLGQDVRKLLEKRNSLVEQLEEGKPGGSGKRIAQTDEWKLKTEISRINKRLTPVDSIYTLRDSYGRPFLATVDVLDTLSQAFETDWAIAVGIDRSDPLKADLSVGARTIISVVAKGLPYSRNNLDLFNQEGANLNYVYFLLHLAHCPSSSLEEIKEVLKEVADEYQGIDTVCSEKWGIWDLVPWCEEQGMKIDPITSTYNVQKAMFTEFFTACRTCRFKAPTVHVEGSKSPDILREEMLLFDHNMDKKWFGSPEKRETFGVQDDAVYSVGLAFYGGRLLNLSDFRQRKGALFLGQMISASGLSGKY
jgi:hypothetical protein